MLGTSPASLLDVIGHDVELRKVASTNGGEWAGPCPFCGGRDRFRVWPSSDRPGYYCRRCERRGDAIQYVRERHNLSFSEACRELAIHRPKPKLAGQIAGPRLKDEEPPNPKWQEKARAFCAWGEKQLWSQAGIGALTYLRERRGLTDATIRHWHLGYNPTDLWRDPNVWSLDGGKIWLPNGIVIPCQVGEVIWNVKVRRPVAGDDLTELIGPSASGLPPAKYLKVRGSKSALFGVSTAADRDVLVITEGEFDAILLWQEAGDLVGVATMGSASDPLGTRWLWELRHCSRILACFDLDDAGEHGRSRLEALSARVRVAAPLGAKDLTEMHQRGGDLRAWTLFNIRKLETERTHSAASVTLDAGEVLHGVSAASASSERDEAAKVGPGSGAGADPDTAAIPLKPVVGETAQPPNGEAVVVDPRPDLVEDSDLWRDILTRAWILDGSRVDGVFGVLDGLRRCGARLDPAGSRVQLGPRYAPEGYWENDAEWLACWNEWVASRWSIIRGLLKPIKCPN